MADHRADLMPKTRAGDHVLHLQEDPVLSIHQVYVICHSDLCIMGYRDGYCNCINLWYRAVLLKWKPNLTRGYEFPQGSRN